MIRRLALKFLIWHTRDRRRFERERKMIAIRELREMLPLWYRARICMAKVEANVLHAEAMIADYKRKLKTATRSE